MSVIVEVETQQAMNAESVDLWLTFISVAPFSHLATAFSKVVKTHQSITGVLLM